MDNNKAKTCINFEIDPSLKEAFEKWTQDNGFTTVAEAIRFLIRDKTKFNPESQGQTTQINNKGQNEQGSSDTS